MNQGSNHPFGLFASLKASVSAVNWKQWLPARGNFVFMLLIAFGLVWAQSSGVFARTSADPGSGVTRPFPYQGRLADASGTPLTNTYPMIFRLYAADTPSAVPLWEENWSGPNSVRVSDGLFSVMLGSLTAIPESVITQNANLWLGITVGTDDEMTPRIQLGSVPFSHQAQTVADGSITSEKIADGAVQRGDLAPDAVPPSIPVGTVISWWRPDASTPLPSGEWAFADGSVVNDPASPLNGKALPDLRDRFIMGVNPDVVGQVGGTNALNLAHSHTVNNHTHWVPNHAHSDGELYANVSVEDDRVYVKRWGPSFNASNANYTGASHSNTHQTDASADIGGITGYWAGSTEGSAPGTNAQLTAAVDNRPAYVGMVYLVKVK